jgi:tetratricopeptide (TPR) repeat protein
LGLRGDGWLPGREEQLRLPHTRKKGRSPGARGSDTRHSARGEQLRLPHTRKKGRSPGARGSDTRHSARGSSCACRTLVKRVVPPGLGVATLDTRRGLGEEASRLYNELGEQSFLSTAAGKLGQALYALDRLEEADAWAGRAAELGASDDAYTQMLWRQVRAKVLARRGEHAEAERLAREAVVIGEETDMLDAQGDTYADLAEVLLLGGKADEAGVALEQALERYERKGNLVSARRAQTRLAELHAAAPR